MERARVSEVWGAFMQAVHEAMDLHLRGADASTIADVLQHGRELLEIVDEKIAADAAAQSRDVPSAARGLLTELRGRLRILERAVMTTTH